MAIKAFTVPGSDDQSHKWDVALGSDPKPHPRAAKNAEPLKTIMAVESLLAFILCKRIPW